MKNLTKAAVGVAGAGAIAAASLAGAGAAQAATPGDLKVTATVKCQTLGDKTYTQRLVAVENVGGTAITGVRVGSVAGPEATVPALVANTPKASGGLLFASTTDIAAGKLGAGQSVVAAETFEGCGAPYAIVGYSIGNEIDNVLSAPNFDFDWGLVPETLPAAAAS